jgi:hypothetical protein
MGMSTRRGIIVYPGPSPGRARAEQFRKLGGRQIEGGALPLGF